MSPALAALTPLFSSTAVVALAELGDKTMLLAILLATRFREQWQIIAGILAATVVNHLASAFIGSEAAGLLASFWFRLLVALGFLAMAAWTLIPDKLDDDDEPRIAHGYGPFLTTAIAFFLVEMGDKTQIATIALGARFHDVPMVAAGTTLGMMLVDGPAVFFGEALVKHISLKAARTGAALLFAALGLWQVWDLA